MKYFSKISPESFKVTPKRKLQEHIPYQQLQAPKSYHFQLVIESSQR